MWEGGYDVTNFTKTKDEFGHLDQFNSVYGSVIQIKLLKNKNAIGYNCIGESNYGYRSFRDTTGARLGSAPSRGHSMGSAENITCINLDQTNPIFLNKKNFYFIPKRKIIFVTGKHFLLTASNC